MNFDKINSENLVDMDHKEISLGDKVAAGDDYGVVIGFTSTDLGHYPTVAVDFGCFVEEFTGYQTHYESASVVDEVRVLIPTVEARCSRR